ncbi:MAG TPA: hypothetical protein VGI40_19420 [Pirellulaceae bacterium]|jgi:hypothetical protein
MLFLFLFLVLAATAAGVWFQGLWSAAITIVNMLLAMIIATSFYEPICSALDKIGAVGTYTYLLDFIVLWILFAVAFGILRSISDLLSRENVKFDMPVEMAGRSVLALFCGWLMVVFVAFTLQMAPLNAESPLGAFATPRARSFLGFAPDRMWQGFMYSRSRPAALGGNQFDQNADFALRYHDRRQKYAKPGESMRFPRQ